MQSATLARNVQCVHRKDVRGLVVDQDGILTNQAVE
jgi:hypothetical protein